MKLEVVDALQVSAVALSEYYKLMYSVVGGGLPLLLTVDTLRRSKTRLQT